MKTIDKIIDNMKVGQILRKHNQSVLKIEDIIKTAKKQGLKNPEKELDEVIKLGFFKKIEECIVIPEYIEIKDMPKSMKERIRGERYSKSALKNLQKPRRIKNDWNKRKRHIKQSWKGKFS